MGGHRLHVPVSEHVGEGAHVASVDESIVLCKERRLVNDDVGGAEVVVPVHGFFCGLTSAIPRARGDSATYAKSSSCTWGIDILLHAVVDGKVRDLGVAPVHRIDGSLTWERQGSLLSFIFFFRSTAGWLPPPTLGRS